MDTHEVDEGNSIPSEMSKAEIVSELPIKVNAPGGSTSEKGSSVGKLEESESHLNPTKEAPQNVSAVIQSNREKLEYDKKMRDVLLQEKSEASEIPTSAISKAPETIAACTISEESSDVNKTEEQLSRVKTTKGHAAVCESTEKQEDSICNSAEVKAEANESTELETSANQSTEVETSANQSTEVETSANQSIGVQTACDSRMQEQQTDVNKSMEACSRVEILVEKVKTTYSSVDVEGNDGLKHAITPLSSGIDEENLMNLSQKNSEYRAIINSTLSVNEVIKYFDAEGQKQVSDNLKEIEETLKEIMEIKNSQSDIGKKNSSLLDCVNKCLALLLVHSNKHGETLKKTTNCPHCKNVMKVVLDVLNELDDYYKPKSWQRSRKRSSKKLKGVVSHVNTGIGGKIRNLETIFKHLTGRVGATMSIAQFQDKVNWYKVIGFFDHYEIEARGFTLKLELLAHKLTWRITEYDMLMAEASDFRNSILEISTKRTGTSEATDNEILIEDAVDYLTSLNRVMTHLRDLAKEYKFCNSEFKHLRDKFLSKKINNLFFTSE